MGYYSDRAHWPACQAEGSKHEARGPLFFSIFFFRKSPEDRDSSWPQAETGGAPLMFLLRSEALCCLNKVHLWDNKTLEDTWCWFEPNGFSMSHIPKPCSSVSCLFSVTLFNFHIVSLSFFHFSLFSLSSPSHPSVLVTDSHGLLFSVTHWLCSSMVLCWPGICTPGNELQCGGRRPSLFPKFIPGIREVDEWRELDQRNENQQTPNAGRRIWVYMPRPWDFC